MSSRKPGQKDPPRPRPHKKRGQKGKLTPELTDRLCEAIALGHNNKDATAYAGIAEHTFYRWIDKSRSHEDDFDEQVRDAEDELEAFRKDAGPRRFWGDDDRTEAKRLQRELRAAKRRRENERHPLVTFARAVAEAKRKRYEAVLVRLPDYRDYKADDAYLRHLEHREARPEVARKRKADADKAEAEARIAHCRAEIAERASDLDEAGATGLILPAHIIAMIPAAALEAMRQEAITVIPRRDLLSAAGVESPEELAAFGRMAARMAAGQLPPPKDVTTGAVPEATDADG